MVLFILIGCSLIYINLGSWYGHDVDFDFLPSLKAKQVSDWHSILFYQELIWLQTITGFSPEGTLLSFFTLSRFLLVFSIAYVLHKVLRTDILNLALFPLWVAMVLLYTSSNEFGGTGLDHLFTALLSMFAACCVSAYHRTGLARFTAWVVMVILCIHIIQYRRNAAIIIPLLCWIFILCAFHRKSFVIKGILATLTMCGILIVSWFAIPALIPSRTMHSASVMLVSDIKIAALLKGEAEKTTEYLEMTTGLRPPPESENELGADSRNYSKHKEKFDRVQQIRVALSDKEWNNLLDLYLKFWVKHPQEMLISRCLQSYHMFVSMKIPDNLRIFIKNKYTNITDGMFKSTWYEYQPRTLRKLSFICITICIFLYARVSRKKEIEKVYVQWVIWAYSIAIVYALSFTILTPTPDTRYLAPSRFVLLLAGSVAFVRLMIHLFSLRQRKSLSENSNEIVK